MCAQIRSERVLSTASPKAFFFPYETATEDHVRHLLETYEYASVNRNTFKEERYALLSKSDFGALTNIQAHVTMAKVGDPRTRHGMLIVVVDEARTFLEIKGLIEEGVVDTYFLML